MTPKLIELLGIVDYLNSRRSDDPTSPDFSYSLERHYAPDSLIRRYSIILTTRNYKSNRKTIAQIFEVGEELSLQNEIINFDSHVLLESIYAANIQSDHANEYQNKRLNPSERKKISDNALEMLKRLPRFLQNPKPTVSIPDQIKIRARCRDFEERFGTRLFHGEDEWKLRTFYNPLVDTSIVFGFYPTETVYYNLEQFGVLTNYGKAYMSPELTNTFKEQGLWKLFNEWLDTQK